MVKGDDILLITEVLLMVNGDDVLLMVNKN